MRGVTAKVDTGAFTGALHATRIHEEKEGSEKVLYFSPFDHPEEVHKTTIFERGIVRSSNGATTERYFIETSVVLQKRRYTITLSLINRSEMKWSVLIGRRFLRANEFVVDVTMEKK
ncbi:ATP-dependent zinc protease [Candidatus Saccharibacteria bacterium]|nr:ATP-dependent zinc protease [Candidatus Saccharibacteria bacterium]